MNFKAIVLPDIDGLIVPEIVTVPPVETIDGELEHVSVVEI